MLYVYQHLDSSSKPRSCFIKPKDFKVCLNGLERDTIDTQLLLFCLYAMLCDERAQAFFKVYSITHHPSMLYLLRIFLGFRNVLAYVLDEKLPLDRFEHLVDQSMSGQSGTG